MADDFADGPLFPDGMGEILHGLLNPQTAPGPPDVHTFKPPEPEYDDEGNPYWPPTPTITVTSTDAERVVGAAVERARAKLTPVQRFAADEIARITGHVLLYGEIPPGLSPDVRGQLERAMEGEGLLP